MAVFPELPLLLALVSALAAAIANLSARYLLRSTPVRDYLSINFALLFLMLAPFAPFALQIRPSGLTWICLILAALLDGGANYFYFKAFEINDAGTASALLATSPLFTLLFMPLLGDLGAAPLGLGALIGIGLTGLGIVWLAQALIPKNTSRRPVHIRQAASLMGMPLLAALLFGLNVYLVKFILAAGLASPFSYYFLRAPLIALITGVLLHPRLDWITPRTLGFAMGRGLFVIIQWLAFLYAVNWGNAALVKAVSEITPLFVLAFSTTLLGEKLTPGRLMGAGLIVAGLITLSLN